MFPIAEYAGSRLRRLSGQLRHLPRTLALVWKATPGLSLLWTLLLVLQGLLPIATVYLTRSIVNALVGAIRSGGSWSAIQPALVLAAWMGAVLLATQLLRSAAFWVRTSQSELVKDYLAELIQTKSLEVDLSFYDSSDFYDHLHRARYEARYRPMALLDGIGALLQSTITIAALLTILFAFGPLLPLALIASALPTVYVIVRNGQRRHRWHKEITWDERRAWYYDLLLTDGQSAAEMRLYGLGEHFRKAHRAIRDSLRRQQSRLNRQQAIHELGAELISLGLIGATAAWMIGRAIRGLVSIGDMALLYQAFNQGLSLARNALGNVGQLYENTLFLGNLFEFLDLTPRLSSPSASCGVVPPAWGSVQFENVAFAYPGTDRPALRDFSVILRPNQIAAFVGPNGAGKSTIVKLLCRFYDPDQGSISIAGVPLPQIPVEELRRQLTVQFQTPVQYNASARANIAYGKSEKPSEGSGHPVEHAAHISGADEFIRRLPHGYDSQLGHWFDEGNELSLGQWQRIGLARAFYREAPIIILDEPTSAMDPWAEIAWAERFRHFAQGRIAVLITHRFTTAMFSDVIHVVSEGSIVESGSHHQLLTQNGLYAQGWAAQNRC